MTVIPECICRGSSAFKELQNGFPLEPCGNDVFASFCKRLLLFDFEKGITWVPNLPEFLPAAYERIRAGINPQTFAEKPEKTGEAGPPAQGGSTAEPWVALDYMQVPGGVLNNLKNAVTIQSQRFCNV